MTTLTVPLIPSNAVIQRVNYRYCARTASGGAAWGVEANVFQSVENNKGSCGRSVCERLR